MKSSLIILTYNELYEGTIPCVESIYKYTNTDDFELIIVDNASNDGTQNYLKELKEKYSNVKIQLNLQNKGFAAGINDGLKLAEGDFLFLLNNDILVAPNWLDNLINPLIINPKIGLIGPISNGSGNEQGVSFEGLNKNNYIEITKNYTENQRPEISYTKRLAFFCVAMSRAVFEKVGYFDENFGIGWFEDDDYCLRVRNEGYKVAIAEGCFIYHIGSLSFKKVNPDVAIKNKIYFTKKHKCIWTTTKSAIAYSEKFKEDLEKYCINNSSVDPAIERILVRYQSFQDYLEYLNTLERDAQEKKQWPLFHRLTRKISSPERFLRNYIKEKFSSKSH